MERKSNFCRALSAILILFGGTFSWAAGACDISKYDCQDLSGYDNSHSITAKISPAVIKSGEIPNDGNINSSLGSVENSTQTQIIDFSDLNYWNYDDAKARQESLKTRIGGSGSYVFGDVVAVGGPIIQPMPNGAIGSSTGAGYTGGYIHNGGIGTFNSSKDTIELPKGITKDDIVYARVYWYGHIYNNESFGNYLNGTDKAYFEKIKGYQDIKLKIGSSGVYDINRDTCQGRFAYNAKRGGGRYNMIYTCSADITDKIKANFKDYDDEIEIAAGDINAQEKIFHSNVDTVGNNIWDISTRDNRGFVKNNAQNSQRLPYGGWYVVLIYDKSMRAQAEFRGLDFPDEVSNDIKWAEAKKADVDGDPKEHLNKFFKPKNVTLYDGYLEAQGSSIDYVATGFFTPKSGDVQGKLVFASFGANKAGSVSRTDSGNPKITDAVANDSAGLYAGKNSIGATGKDSPNRLKNDYNPSDRPSFNGSRTKLVLDDDGKYETKGSGTYHQGFDLDEFDISNYTMKDKDTGKGVVLDNAQTSINMKFYVKADGTWNRALVPFFALSVDIYVPHLCYEEKMYDTAGWLGFYNEDGTPKTNAGKVEDVTVVTGENLYYRTEFRNQKDASGGGEAADSVYVKVNFGNSNTYVRDSSGIDNRFVVTHEPDGTDRTDNAEFVYLLDNKAGAYTTQPLRAAGGTPNAGDPYGTGQFNSLVNDEFKFYIGRNAGEPSPQGPLGGTMRPGDSAYVEFNATIGRTFTYNPIRYTAGYKMSLGGGEAIDGPNTIMERCKSTAKTVEINLLNGLKVVNQNYKDYCDGKYVGSFASADYKCGSATDVNKTKSQDDRLYTQVAELPFDVNLIFKPDINDVFRYDCASYGVDGKCLDYGENVCKNFGGIFEMNNNACVPINGYVKLPDGTWGIKYKEGKLDGSLQKFILPGKLYLSAIRAGSGCKYIDNRAKIPFIVDGKRYMTNYDTDFMNYQETKEKLVKPVAKVAFEDAFNGVTFMFSYYPRGIEKPDMNTTIYVGDWNSTQAYNYDRTTKTWTEVNLDNSEEYYIWVQTQMLYEKYIRGYKLNLAEDEKRRLVENWFDNPDNVDKIANFDKELKDIEDEIMNARTFFGVEMSPDGSFHVCDSDSFVVRPAHFRVDIDAAKKYAKLVDANATGDITTGIKTAHENIHRVGGDYKENADILGSMFYAESIKGHSVPNYNQIIGGNLGESRFAIRKSYNSYSLDNALEDSIDMFKENKTYLKPFISTECYGSIQNQAFFTEENINNRSDKLYLTKNYSCANDQPVQYNGFELENGQYKLIASDVSKEVNNADRQEIGKIIIDESCKVEGHIFGSYYEKVWDKDANNLFANFGVKKIEINSGYAEIQRFSPNELMAQALLEPDRKDVVPAALYTGMLLDKTSKDKLGAIFNYFNVGDVLVKVYDNSWTDNHGDQTFDKRVGPDGKYWGSTCILNSTSNTPDKFGKVGCDVGMENNQELVLRFKPDRIDLAIEGLGTNNENLDRNGQNDFVYYNSPDIPNAFRTIGGVPNMSMVNDFANLGQVRFLGEAYLRDTEEFKNTIATLYDGTVIEGTYNDETYEVAKCGFANDMNVTINFSFDCNTDPTDQRCATNGVINQTLQNAVYAPYFGHPDINYTIPAGTNFMTNASCQNNNGVSDSRCFRYNVKTARLNAVGNIDTNSMQEADSSVVAGFGIPLPIRFAVSYYTDVRKQSGFINAINTANNIYDPKNPLFVLLARAFKEGSTQNATIYLNFDRMQKSPHLPLYVFANDFSITTLSNSGLIEPAKFDNSGALLNINNAVLIDPNDAGKFTNKPYNDNSDRYENFDTTGLIENAIGFEQHAIETGEALGFATNPIQGHLTATGRVPYILFAYGKANEVNDGRGIVNAGAASVTYFDNVANSPINVNILDALFCDRVIVAGGCGILPNIVLNGENLSPVSNIFSALRASGATNNNGFLTNNLARALGAATIKDIWVEGYYPSANTISIIRDNPNLTNGIEPIAINSENVNGTEGVVTVEVLTRPWLIYTPFIQNVLVDNARNMGNPIQYWNYFTVFLFDSSGQWGGEGEVKDAEEEGDIGSFISGKNFDDIAKGENADNKTPSIRNDRIDW